MNKNKQQEENRCACINGTVIRVVGKGKPRRHFGED